eukprot:58231-Amorphochlora_amoeboformis.AAC.1
MYQRHAVDYRCWGQGVPKAREAVGIEMGSLGALEPPGGLGIIVNVSGRCVYPKKRTGSPRGPNFCSSEGTKR